MSKNNEVAISNELLNKYQRVTEIGGNVFKSNCAVCHCSTTSNCEPGDFPHLNNLFNHLSQDSLENIVNYVADSKKLKDERDVFALQVDKEYLDNFEHNFKQKLTRTEIKNVILWLWVPCVARRK